MIYSLGTLDGDTSQTSWFARKAVLCQNYNRHLWIYLLTPGFTYGYHQHVLGISDITLARHLTVAKCMQTIDPTITEAVNINISSITPEDGLSMALRRGTAHLPHWSRLAICEFYGQLGTANKVAKLFRCSPTTVTNVVKLGAGSFDILSAKRKLAPQQAHPPGKWRAGGKG